MEQIFIIVFLSIISLIMGVMFITGAIVYLKREKQNLAKKPDKIKIDNHSDSTPDEDIKNSFENGYRPNKC